VNLFELFRSPLCAQTARPKISALGNLSLPFASAPGVFSMPFIHKTFDDRFVRMWRLYLRASSASFREGIIEVHQILLSRGQPSNLPLTREGLYSGPEIFGRTSQRNTCLNFNRGVAGHAR